MRPAIYASFAALLMFCHPGIADDKQIANGYIHEVVLRLFQTHSSEGQDGVISALKSCYEKNVNPNDGLTGPLKGCIAQDIAYTNFYGAFDQLTGKKANLSPHAPGPEYLSMEPMKRRVLATTSAIGVVEPELTTELKIISSAASKALTAEANARSNKQ